MEEYIMTKTNVSEELANKIFKIYQAQEVSEKDVKEIKDSTFPAAKHVSNLEKSI